MERPAKGKGRATRPGVPAAHLQAYLARYLETSRFKDYCPNGLQVEGAPRVVRLVSGVSASLALLRAAVRARADTVLVHHGWFWRGEDPCLVGPRRERLAFALAHRLNVFAYHLPLDAHPEVGNNARLGVALGWPATRRFGEQDLGCGHDLPSPVSVGDVVRRVGAVLGREPLVLGPTRQRVRRIAWCTGAAQDLIEEAARDGAQVFISGEASERTTHLARELGVTYLAAGHHATERYGVQALAGHLAAEFGIEHRFIDDPNPV